jgi:hypothetical protein
VSLPQGITGLQHVDDDPPLPLSDFAAFKAHCHEAARTLAGRIRSVEAPIRSVESNFGQAVLELYRETVAILLNAHYPIVGFAEPPTEHGAPYQFIDHNILAKIFRNFGAYEVWTRPKLEAPVTPEALNQLAAVELEQAQYWQPQRIGDLVFNLWD